MHGRWGGLPADYRELLACGPPIKPQVANQRADSVAHARPAAQKRRHAHQPWWACRNIARQATADLLQSSVRAIQCLASRMLKSNPRLLAAD